MIIIYLLAALSLIAILAILFWPGRNRSPYIRRTVSNRNGTGWRPLD
jgi:hypothetical protein